ncbi:inositol monophosphatase family protein [Amycolatopsis sp. lyj-84]|uniref:inositol monophosphatase family protein n=1 Tax=Amycolatopsis sp. lyj-84 TaxID=2789284 RepID=UPI003979C360
MVEVVTTMRADSDVEVAIRAVDDACEVIRRSYGGTVKRFEKGNGDFATGVDLAAERVIRSALRDAYPRDVIFGEEYGTDIGDGSRAWLVDPLCGNVNYAAQTPLVAVNVALRTESGVTAAVSADPLSGEVFWTSGHGAFLRRDGRDEHLVPGAGDRGRGCQSRPAVPQCRGVPHSADAAGRCLHG